MKVIRNSFFLLGKLVKVLHEKFPANIPWFSVGVQYVIEASGMFTTIEKASGHLNSIGVKRVIVTAPSADIPMLIIGVNEEMVAPDDTVVSCASSTLYCLAPIIKILEDNFGITEGFVTSIHAMTPSLKPLDGLCLRGKHWRDHRSIHQNIIPAVTGACKALNKIIPQIRDKLSGLAFRVPIVNVSVLDISLRINTGTSMEVVLKCLHQYSNSSMKGILRISNEDAVSSDFLGEEHSCIFDEKSSFQMSPNFFKLVCWYENEHSYACRVIDIILFSERQFQCRFSPITIGPRPTRAATTDRCRSVFVPHNYSFPINPNMISSTSQDTGFKIKLHPKTLKNTTLGRHYSPTNRTTLGRVVMKTKEALNSFHHDNIISQTQTRQTVPTSKASSFFQSCVHFESTQQTKIKKNEDELRRIKHEFSKVASLTESLLKKSSHDNNELRDAVKDKIEIQEPTQAYEEKKMKYMDGTEKVKDSNSRSRIFPMHRDFEEPEPKHNDCHIISDLENKQCIQRGTIIRIKLSDTHTNDMKNNTILSQNACKKLDYETKLIDKIEINSLPSISEVALQQRDFLEINNICTPYFSNKIPPEQQAFVYNVLQAPKDDECIQNNIRKTEIPTETNNDDELQTKDTLDTQCNHKGNNISEENKHGVDANIILNKDTEEVNESSDLKTNKNIFEKIIQRISMNRVQLTSDEPSRSISPLPSINNLKLRGTRQDIYDKLDSASGSENSFDFNDRKSQVINITDLTKSIEDIARLDKICRIIEISDELSDKLFSTINNTNAQGTETKTWSFKDLCERINLDEFCSKVFTP
ncbi:unnamed protein product [Leptosia nina]|uniref:Glyceraldehyde 3-phosphate dehydrogenase NAD(P) binding domain-containing protein n=1 Tax=Leptosia nina TaxID=320188 RepID=A0AAV1K4B8_9NEOP